MDLLPTVLPALLVHLEMEQQERVDHQVVPEAVAKMVVVVLQGLPVLQEVVAVVVAQDKPVIPDRQEQVEVADHLAAAVITVHQALRALRALREAVGLPDMEVTLLPTRKQPLTRL